MLTVGIDIGKSRHHAALLSRQLLATYTRFDACPTLAIGNDRASFERLLTTLREHGSPEETHVLIERTGHYGHALEHFLQEAGCHLYRIQARARYANNKTDRADARALATLLYNEVELHAPVVDEKLRIRPLVTPHPLARRMRGLVHHRDELARERTQRKNKLTAIGDELFPELPQIYKDPWSESVLALREQFPTPADVAGAPIAALAASRKGHRPTREDLQRLQELAATTIGTRDPSRIASLRIEQRQLIAELRLMNTHVAALDAEIETLIAGSRDGQILASFTGVGPVTAAKLLAGIGSIANFESAAHLRSYLGWAPRAQQTGTSKDSVGLTRGGNPLLKKTMYLVAMTAIHYDPHWKARYQRMVERKCSYDGRRQDYTGKMKVVGTIIGQIIGVMFHLLRKDYELMQAIMPGAEPPSPELYDPAHRSKKAGERPH